MNIFNSVRTRSKAGFDHIRRHKIATGIAVVLVIAAIALLGKDAVDTTSETPSLSTVRVGTVASVSGGTKAVFSGIVRAASEADIKAERGGQVTSVPVNVGQTVEVGTVIATFENAAERAAVLQAEGVYESALASSRQSSTGLAEAEVSLETAKRNGATALSTAYTSANNTLVSSVDIYFSNPNSNLVALRINGYDQTATINAARRELAATMSEWNKMVSGVSARNISLADYAATRSNIADIVSLVDMLLAVTNRDELTTERQSRITALSTTKNTLLTLSTTVEGSQLSLSSAETTYSQAKTAAASSPTAVSSADAAVKQALGSLRAAQAALAKTIIRTPISGVVDVLKLNQGDYIAAQTSIARVAGGKGYEIVFYVGERDKDIFTVGDEVEIVGHATGTILAVAPAIDPVTQKIEVKVATNDQNLVNGASVSVTYHDDTVRSSAKIEVPITAVKFSDTNGFMFVVENSSLKSIPVTVGAINGAYVEITSGIDFNTEFVIDARGKAEGEEVEVITQ